ncbi:heterokaryon incompatibility protein-domain-containing protein [Xylaria sp. FL1777]|nr:heterokaryon incompatibility protein-domain-containing protein [Xylaria sp. FL1777]
MIAIFFQKLKRMPQESEPSSLCERCRALEFDDASLGGQKVWSAEDGFQLAMPEDPDFFIKPISISYDVQDEMPTLPVLQKSADVGCGFCQLLRMAVQREASVLEGSVEIRIRYQWGADNWGLVGLVALIRPLTNRRCNIIDKAEGDEVQVAFGIDGNPGPVSSWLRLQPSPYDDALCDENLAMINSHLPSESDYEPTGSGVSFSPRRLISVGEGEQSLCHLIDTQTEEYQRKWHSSPWNCRYVALSYCWGGPQDAQAQFKTEAGTLKDRVAGFHCKQASQCLRDAIKVTRALGIPFIWVDALCIIQGDRDDWAIQCEQMALVYQHAFLTICTPESSSCRQGFLDRNHPAVEVRFRSRVDEEVRGSYKIRYIGSPGYDGHEYVACDLSDSSWSRRAWTFQEYAMSKRLVAFGAANLHYHERGIMHVEGDVQSDQFVLSMDMANLLSHPENDDERDSWLADLIPGYTGRLLTNATDKLPAIAGVAKLVTGNRADDYFAGIRESELFRDLFWTPSGGNWTDEWEDRDVVLQRLLEGPLIGPSFSWASRSKHVAYFQTGFPVSRRSFRDYAAAYTKAKLSVQRKGLNAFGEVESGSLVMTTRLVDVPADVRLLEDRGWRKKRWRADEQGQYVAYLTLDWRAESSEEFASLRLLLIGSCICSDPDCQLPDSDIHSDHTTSTTTEMAESDSRSNTTLVATAQCAHSHSKDENDRYAFGLVIHPTSQKGRYIRVGVFSSWPKGRGGLKFFKGIEEQVVELV